MLDDLIGTIYLEYLPRFWDGLGKPLEVSIHGIGRTESTSRRVHSIDAEVGLDLW